MVENRDSQGRLRCAFRVPLHSEVVRPGRIGDRFDDPVRGSGQNDEAARSIDSLVVVAPDRPIDQLESELTAAFAPNLVNAPVV